MQSSVLAADALFRRARELLTACPCAGGCPSCVGAAAGPGTKQALLKLLDRLLEDR